MSSRPGADLRRKLAQLRSDLRHHGLYHALLRVSASRFMPQRRFLLAHIEILRLAEINPPALARVPGGYEWRRADESLIGELMACAPADTQPDLFAGFFAMGARCCVARHGGRVVAYMWAFPGRYVLTYDRYVSRNRTIQLDDRSVFLGNGMVADAHRLRGLFPHLVAFTVAQWPHGTRVYSAVERANVLSLQSHTRLGFVRWGQVVCLTLFSVTRFLQRARPGVRWTSPSAAAPITLDVIPKETAAAPVTATALRPEVI